MEQKKISVCLTETAQVVFQKLGIDSKKYGTAYGGESAGLDLYYMGETVTIPGRNKWVAFGESPIVMPTGLRVTIPDGHVGLIQERGSIVKTGLVSRAGVIDPGYTGEVFVSLQNLGERDTKIETGAKLPVQLIVIPCKNNYEVVDYSEYVKRATESSAQRKEGSLGSTNQGSE